MPYLAFAGDLHDEFEHDFAVEVDVPEQGWAALLEYLDDFAYEPMNDDDPHGPRQLTDLAYQIDSFAAEGIEGTVMDENYYYSVERIDTH